MQQQATSKPYLGHAVLSGKIRFLSVSQITQFDPEADGGCNRRWAFNKVFGKKEPSSEAMMIGVNCAKEAEHYLKKNEDVLGPIMRAGKHLMPVPGPDLEVEEPLGDIYKAATLREEFLKASTPIEKNVLATEMRRTAGLVAANIPLMGAADARHRRGEYIDENGILRQEMVGYRVVEVIDHKTTGRINDYYSASGKLYKGNAKSVEQVLSQIQMIGYAVHAYERYPDTTHTRLSHIYYQRNNGYTAVKRTGLISVEEALRRWERVDALAREMEQVAQIKNAQEAEPNTASCFSYGKDCPHKSYCNPPAGSVADLFQIRTKNEGDKMSTGLFGQLQNPGATNGVSTTTAAPAETQGLFGAAAAATAPPIPAAPPMSDAEREAAVAAAKARFQAEDGAIGAVAAIVSYGFCSGCGTAVNSSNASRPPNGIVVHIGCPASLENQFRGAAPSAPPPIPTVPVAVPVPPIPRHIGAVNPPDSPPPDPIAAASPLTPEAIATITDPQLKKIAEDHAAAHAAQAAAHAAANPTESKAKTSGRCPAGTEGTIQALTPKEISTRKTNCKTCGKALVIKDKDFQSDYASIKVPGHIMDKKESAAPVVVAPQIPPPIPSVAIPAAPVAAAPPIPVAPVVAAPPPPPPLPVSAVSIPEVTVNTTVTPVEVALAPPLPIAVIAPAVKSAAEKAKELFELMNESGNEQDATTLSASSIAASLIAITERLDQLLARK